MPNAYHVEKWSGETLPDARLLREAMTAEGFRVYAWADGPGTEYGQHSHPDDRSHWILSGMLELTVEGAGTFQLRAGDRDHLPANTLHSARVVGEEGVAYLVGEKV